MEEQQTYFAESPKNLELNEIAVDALKVSAKWSMFLAIIGFIGIALMLVAAVLMGSVMSMLPDDTGSSPFSAMKGFISIFYVILAGLYFPPTYYLYKYSSDIKNGLNFRNSDDVAKALVSLKSHHKFLGISIIVFIALYIITILGMVMFFVSKGTGM